MIIILGDFFLAKNTEEKIRTRLILSKNKRTATRIILKYLSKKFLFFLTKSKLKEFTKCNLTPSEVNMSSSISRT